MASSLPPAASSSPPTRPPFSPPALGGSHAFFRAGAATAAFLHPGTPDDPRGAPLSLADLASDAPVAAHVLAPDPLAVAYDELRLR